MVWRLNIDLANPTDWRLDFRAPRPDVKWLETFCDSQVIYPTQSISPFRKSFFRVAGILPARAAAVPAAIPKVKAKICEGRMPSTLLKRAAMPKKTPEIRLAKPGGKIELWKPLTVAGSRTGNVGVDFYPWADI